MPLQAFKIKKLNRNSLSLQILPHIIIYITFMHRPKPTLTQQEITREILSYGPQLTQLKVV